jgi:hypothetical protein
MAAFKYFDPYAEMQKQEGSVATVATVATHSASEPKSVAELATVAGGKRENENPSPAICIFCRQPVERGKADTAGLGGHDCHTRCYWQRYPTGHLNGEQG